MGLGNFIEGAGKAAGNVVKGAAFVADPRNADNIIEGAGKAASFVAKNPGKTLDIAGEVGKGILKDQLTPANLAINAGLLAATVATGGAAAPAFAAKLGLGTKSVEAGLTAAKVGDTVADATKAAKTGSKVLKTVDRVLGAEKTAIKANKLRNPISALRGAAGEKILAGGATPGAPSLARQITSAAVTGTGRLAPTQAAGMSDDVYRAQKNVWRAQRAITRGDQVNAFGKGTEVAADPAGYAFKQASKQINAQGTNLGYTDRGQTSEGLYAGGSSQVGTYDGSQVGRSASFKTGQVGQTGTGWSGNFSPMMDKTKSISIGQQPAASTMPTLTGAGQNRGWGSTVAQSMGTGITPPPPQVGYGSDIGQTSGATPALGMGNLMQPAAPVMGSRTQRRGAGSMYANTNSAYSS